MNISRKMALLIHHVLDEWVPPFIRDSKWFMFIPFKLLFGRKANAFFTFKDAALSMSDAEFKKTYEYLADVHIQRETDLNEECMKAIVQMTSGTVLDVGCGRGYLARILSTKSSVTATDIVINPMMAKQHPEIAFVQANIEHLPFKDNSFDTVVCTHTLEHVQRFSVALQELRRVAKKRLIIVVPKQRPYKYTFDLHLRFFPYRHSLLAMMGVREHKLEELGGDWFYFEEIK